MIPNRMLRFGSSGEDVLRVKLRLFSLGCYAPHITAISTSRFGSETRNAVLNFQAKNALVADGIVGPITWSALFPEDAALSPQPRGEIPANIGETAAGLIASALEGASDRRREIVLDALQFVFDPTLPRDYPTSLYIRGGNLYNSDLTPNVITLARIRSGALRQPEYYDGGRQEMMEAAVRENPAITGADCSGGVVGLLRHAGVVKPGFDLAANGFAASKSVRKIEESELLPADLLHKSGHIGIYVGGGYVAEWMGGAYGCQLTRVSARRGWNFVKHKEERFGAWTTFLRPKWY